MLGEVTPDNLHLFISGKSAAVAMLIAKESGISSDEALLRFYATRTYKRLECEATKYWHYSPAQLYQIMKDDE